MKKILGLFSKFESGESRTAAQLEKMMALGSSLQSAGKSSEAAEVYEAILKLDPQHWSALNAMAEIAVQGDKTDVALKLYDDLIERNRSLPKAFYKRANILNHLGRWPAALDGYDEAVRLDPNFGAAFCNKGTVLGHLGRWEEALASFDAAIACDRSDSIAFYNRGSALVELKRPADALASYNLAIALNGDYIEAYINRGHLLRSAGNVEEALASYDEAIRRRPIHAEAFQGRGLCLGQLRRFEEALHSHEKAIELKSDHVGAHIARANMLKWLNRHALAIESYVKAIELEPSHAEAFEGYGFCLFSSGLIEAAIQCYDRALELEPNRRYLLGLRRHAQMHISDWRGWAADLESIANALPVGAAVVQPFILSALLDSPSLQRMAAEIWAREECPPDHTLGPIPRRERKGKIRVGYFSADFRAHPVSLLTAELFETHDRELFECIAFASSPDSQDPIRQRLLRAFDRFIDVYDKPDIEIARLSRQMEIDIAIDLGGYTVHNRTGIFALRAAPIQLSYIGYLGTMGAPYMDYLIADETIIPAEHRKHYTEKILYLPCYQANDSQRRAGRPIDRGELGLPATEFVFCCFNATYKLTPPTFAAWMRILRRVERSVLFLYVDNAVAKANLVRQAAIHEIDPARIVFGERVPLDQYLSRFQAMDLFLDTSPYNAGATASDALWAGLPVLTCAGQSFASRYAASLLKAVELPELITTTIEGYEDLAVSLATGGDALASMRERLSRNRGKVRLFDTPRFTQSLEYAFLKIFEQWRENLPTSDTYPAG